MIDGLVCVLGPRAGPPRPLGEPLKPAGHLTGPDRGGAVPVFGLQRVRQRLAPLLVG